MEQAVKTAPLRVLVADDQDLVRRGFQVILNSYDNIEVVGLARDGEEAVELAQQLKPDVVLMDIRMPRKNGIEATRDIVNNPLLRKTHVLVLTTFDTDEYVYDALAAGASGFLLKDVDPDEIADAIAVVAQGDALIQPKIMKRLVETFVAARPQAGRTAAPGANAGTAGRAHRARTGNPAVSGPGPEQRGNRPGAVHLPRHGENPSGPHHGENRRPRPCPAGGVRL